MPRGIYKRKTDKDKAAPVKEKAMTKAERIENALTEAHSRADRATETLEQREQELRVVRGQANELQAELDLARQAAATSSSVVAQQRSAQEELQKSYDALDDRQEDLVDVLTEEWTYHKLRTAAIERQLRSCGVILPGTATA